MDLTIRWMIKRDFPSVVEIERSSFDCPWKEGDFVKCLNQKNIIGMTAEIDDQVVGYVIYGLQKTSMEIMNLAVAEKFRRMGVATHILDRIKSKLNLNRRTQIQIAVADYNLHGHMLLKSAGFKAVGISEQHFENDDGSTIDAYLFAYELKHQSLLNNRISKYYCEEAET